MLSKKQQNAARAMFAGRMNDDEIGREFNVSARTLARWRENAEFAAELERLCAAAVQEARCLLARSAPAAAARLAGLLDADKPDIARRAALDMIDRCFHRDAGILPALSDERKQDAFAADITDDEARDMLATLIQGMKE